MIKRFHKPLICLGIMLAVIASYEALRLLYLHIATPETCSTLMGVPVCFIDLILYGVMTFAWFGHITERNTRTLFIIGFVPAFLLNALTLNIQWGIYLIILGGLWGMTRQFIPSSRYEGSL
ncbi:MAG: hypothetical protein JKY11_04175 [Alphaproteobacteria bacterium]|nr:hypothetical protein [Alphaproteobacteria bacterium]